MGKQFTDGLSLYDYILSSKGVEFHAARTWEKVNREWIDYFTTVSIEKLISFVTCSTEEISPSVPKSLRALRIWLKSFELNRECVKNPRSLWESWNGTIVNDYHFRNDFPEVTSNNLIRKRMKSKKQHEINRLIELITQLQKFMENHPDPIDSLVDIGAGVGHLSRIISLTNKLPVLAVEGNHQFTLAANSLDEKLIENSRKISSETGDLNFGSTPIRYTSFVTEELFSQIDQFASKSAILVGLHCCGDFSSTILNVFRKSKKAKALILLGCCYHKEFQSFHFLNPKIETNLPFESEDQQKSTVFPLSQKWSGCELSYLHRELACHSNENMLGRFQKDDVDVSRYGRAHLEKWIWEVSESPDDRNIGMCSVNCIEGETTFEEYIRKATQKRGNHLLDKLLEMIPQEELSKPVSSLRSSEFDSFDVLRLMFAPAIESVIIDDRLEFLRENGFEAKCVPLFEATISPRNLAIVAYKL